MLSMAIQPATAVTAGAGGGRPRKAHLPGGLVLSASSSTWTGRTCLDRANPSPNRIEVRRKAHSGPQLRTESILECGHDLCDRFGNFLGSQRALGVAEKHMERQAPVPG